MSDSAEREYVAALAAYQAALARLIEAKRHKTPTPRDLSKARQREQRRLQQEEWQARHAAYLAAYGGRDPAREAAARVTAEWLMDEIRGDATDC